MTATTLLLPLKDPRTDQALCDGWLSIGGGGGAARRRLIARKILGDGGGASVLFEQVESAARPRGLGPWLAAVRSFSLTATATPCVAVFFLLLAERIPLRVAAGLGALLGVLCLQAATNVFNDVEDYRRLIDLPGTLGGSGVIQNGWFTPAELRRLAWGFLVLGASLGLPTVLSAPSSLAPIALLGGLGVLFYSGHRLGLKYIALGDLAVWILCGPALTLGYALAVAGVCNGGVLWLGGFFGFLATALLHVNNLQDMNLDRARGVDTLAIRLGFKGSLRFLFALYAGAGLSLLAGVAAGSLPGWALISVGVTLAAAAPWLKSIASALGPESALLADCRLKAAQIHLAAGAALIAGLLAARLA